MYRSILRNIARTNLQRMGVQQLNKRKHGLPSKFATNWRLFTREMKKNV